MSSVIPAPDGNTSVNLEEPAGYASYEWRNSLGQIVGTDRVFAASKPGKYIATVTELYGCSAKPSDSFYVASSSGPNPPSPASNLTGYALSQTSIQLNWSNNLHPTYNETAFEIYRATQSGGPYTLVGMNPADSLGFIDKNLSANTKYYYIVRSIDSSSAATSSDEDSVLTLVDKTAPSAPANLSVTKTTTSSVDIKWNASTDNASVKNYIIYIDGIKSYLTEDTAFTVYNLTHGQAYTFVVKAIDPTGNMSVASNQVTGSAVYEGLTYNYYTYTGSWSSMPDLNSLVPVKTGTQANISLNIASQSTNYAISWQGIINIRRAGTYTFFTSSDDGSIMYINDTKVVNNDGSHGTIEKSGTYTFSQPGLYSFRLDFYQGTGGAALTASWQASSLGIGKSLIPDSAFTESVVLEGNAPAMPTVIKASIIAYDSVKVNWTDNSNNETGFEIYRSTAANGTYQIINTVKANLASFIDTTVRPSSTYYYKVQAINKYGSSGFDPASMGGLNYSYYESGNFSAMPDFSNIDPVKTGNLPNITLAIKNKNNDYAIKFVGSIKVPITGQYTFFTKSDDGSNLYIDGFDASHQIVNNSYLQGPTERSGSISLNAGIHTVYITFFQHTGGDFLTASYSGPGINKQIIPDSVLANGHNKVTTPGLPAVPSVPDNLNLIPTSADAIHLAWTEASSNATSFRIYRSDGNNTSFRLLKEVTVSHTSYVDSGLYANTDYYYKIEAINAGGSSGFSNEAKATTLDHLPQISNIANQSIRYGTTAQIGVSSSDVDNEPLALSVENLPTVFASFTDYGDGTGLLTFNPLESQQGIYRDIKVMVTDQHGGKDSVLFNLTVNDNYPPTINIVPPIVVNAPSSTTDTITSNDPNLGDAATWHTTGLPDFISVNPIAAGRKLLLNIHPSVQDSGHYSFQVSVTDSSGGLDEKTVDLTVNYLPLKKWYLNFKYQTSAGSPWNNITGVSTTGLMDDNGETTGVGLNLQTTWWSAFNGGDVTGNNSGIYPDNVIKDYYYFGIFGGPNSVNGQVNGLNADQTYSITFFASSIWSNVADNGYTVFQIGAKKDSIYVQANTSRSLTFSHLIPSAGGSISFTMSKGAGAAVGYLNSMVVSTEMQTPPLKPSGIKLSNVTTSTGNGVRVSWADNSDNLTRTAVYRSTNKDSIYTLLNPGASNGSDSVYLDQNINPNTRYYYYLVAVNPNGNSISSDTAGIITSASTQFIDTRKWYLSFKYQTSAGSPWNNITGVTTAGLKDDQGEASNVSLNLQTTWWSAFNGGDVTGNNSGVYPDNVIKDYYYFGIFGGPNSVNGQVKGLDATRTYSITFFASSIWSNVADNGYTVFQIGTKKDSIYVQANTNRTLTFSHLMPSADGNINFTMSKGLGAAVGYLNAIVVSTESTIPPNKPINLSLINVTGSDRNQVKVSWDLGSNNSDSIKVYRSTEKDGQYSLLNPSDANGNNNDYIDSTVLSNTTYYYYLVAANEYGRSNSTDTLDILTPSAPKPAPIISAIADVNVAGGGNKSVQVSATSQDGSAVTFSLQNAPSFVTLADNSNGSANLTLDPTTEDVGRYDSIEVIATTAAGASAATYFSINVTDGGLSDVIYLNFTDAGHPYSSPWNNIFFTLSAGSNYSNLIDYLGKPSNTSVTMVDAWSGIANYGINTLNNSGLFPDGVMGSYFTVSSDNPKTIKVSGLDPSKRYNLVLFGSSMYNGYNFTTDYTTGNQSIVVNNSRNKTKAARFNGLIPDQSGTLSVSVARGATADQGVLNAMIIESLPNNALISPAKLKAVPLNNTIHLTWIDRSYDETSFEIYRATSLNGQYTEITEMPANAVYYDDNSVVANKRYFYKVRAKNGTDSSAYSNVASVISPQFQVYINFNQKEANAPMPWNNIHKVPVSGDTYGPFYDSHGQNTNITIEMGANFEGENNVGVVTGNNSGIYPDIVMQGEYYLDKGMDTIVMKLTNLNLSMQYDLTFFGSLVNFGWNNTTVFLVNNKITALTTTNNSTETTSLNNIYPDENGQIIIKINCTSDSRYAILGAMTIQAHNNYDDQGNTIYGPLAQQAFEMINRMSSNDLLGKTNKSNDNLSIITTYPNPFNKFVIVKMSSPVSDKLLFNLYNTGGMLMDQQMLPVSSGMNVIRYQPKTNLITGVYILSIKSQTTGKRTSVKLIKIQ
jgi:hypothetical protein